MLFFKDLELNEFMVRALVRQNANHSLSHSSCQLYFPVQTKPGTTHHSTFLDQLII